MKIKMLIHSTPLLALSIFVIIQFSVTDLAVAAEANQSSSDLQVRVSTDTLVAERQILERQAERQYVGIEKLADRNFSAFESLVNRAVGIFGLIAAIAGGLFAWMFGKSRKELRDDIREQLEKDAEKIMAEEKEQFRTRIQEVQRQIDDLSAYKKRQVTWVTKLDDEGATTAEKALYAAGVGNLNNVAPGIGEGFEIGEPDLVILSFDGTDEARRKLGVVVERLKSESPPVPLLIYTFSIEGPEVRLNDADRAILKGFDWWIPVNFPAQLLAQTQLLIRRERRLLGGLNG